MRGVISHIKFQENFQANLFGVLFWIERFLPYFIEGRKGTFAAISSMSVYRETHKDRVGYSASKKALNKTFENLRLAYSECGIRFVILNMGRMQKERDIVGISYSEAANKIYNILKFGNHSGTLNIPLFQYVLTRAVCWVPDVFFKRYIMR